MIINFRSMPIHPEVKEVDLVEHFNFLSNFSMDIINTTHRQPPPGFEEFHCVDIVGKSIEWVNEAFPKERFEWYLWFESVFLVTPEMYSHILLKNS